MVNLWLYQTTWAVGAAVLRRCPARLRGLVFSPIELREPVADVHALCDALARFRGLAFVCVARGRLHRIAMCLVACVATLLVANVWRAPTPFLLEVRRHAPPLPIRA